MEEVPYPACYYVKKFKQLDEKKQNDFNWSAATFGPFWMLYRKMYLWSLLIVLSLSINYLFFFEATISFSYFLDSNSRVKIIGWLFYQMISAYVYGKYGNLLYYEHVKKKVSQGYHLVNDISATISSGVIIMIAMFLPMTALSATLLILKFLPFIKARIVNGSPWVWAIHIIEFIILSAILCVYHGLDTLTLKKSNKTNSTKDTEISEKNIQKYLLMKKRKWYIKIFNIVICGVMLMVAYYTIRNWY